MTRVKICGIANSEDARAAVEYGADALGFIQVPDTPRYLTLDAANEIGLAIPPFVAKVFVFRDRADWLSEDGINRRPKYFDAFQYYTNERGLLTPPGESGGGQIRYIRAYRVQNAASLEEIEATYREASAILLDTYHKDKLGGAGATFNWELAVEAKARFALPIILAGGLTSENVGEAIARVRPYAVDVSSGVEAEPGHKDHAKLRAFLRAVRQADARLDP